MARNADIVLTPAERAMVATRAKQLTPMVGGHAVVEFVKRDSRGQGAGTRVLRGKVESVKCNGDHGTVTIAVEEGGYRSANLWAITKVTRLVL